MRFIGKYNGTTNGKAFKGPLFSAQEKIFVLDYEKVIDVQKRRYVNGNRSGSDYYKPHNQCRDLILRALFDYDKVVLWSTSPRIMDLKGFPFNDIHQKIIGAEFLNDRGELVRGSNSDGEYVKNLNVLSPSLKKVIALEDEDTFFRPLDRVVIVSEHENLMHAYMKARDKTSKPI